MHWKPILALLAASAVAVPAVALAAEGESRSTDEAVASPPTSVPDVDPCTPLRAIYSRKNWREEHPARGEDPCSGDVRKWRKAHGLYRHYRLIAPIRCHDGEEGYYVKSCSLVRCESEPDFSWGSVSYAGALGVYQLMPFWGPPWPPDSFRDRVRHHEIADGLGLSNWNASAHCW